MQNAYFIHKARVGRSTGEHTAANHILHKNSVPYRIAQLLFQEARLCAKVTPQKYDKYVYDMI